MMQSVLENNTLKATFKSKGAELCSLILKSVNTEMIWQADAAFWPRHAPVLFPIVGKLKDNTFYYRDKPYHLPQHGFARDKEFKLISKTANEMVFSLTSDEESLKVYPFHFEFNIIYKLDGNKLTVAYNVRNNGVESMYFSVGAHPAFRCPLLENEHIEDYYIEFEEPETAERHLLKDGLFSGETKKVFNKANIIPLRYDLFTEDALVFKDLKSNSIALKSKRNPHEIRMSFKGFPYLGIWTKGPGAKFICLEPWLGLSDASQHSGRLEEKEGLIKLDQQVMFEKEYCLELI